MDYYNGMYRITTGYGIFTGRLVKKQTDYWIEIVKIESCNSVLVFPAVVDKYPVISVNLLRQGERFSHVQVLCISKQITNLEILDFMFPNLEKIQLEPGSPFHVKGFNLYSKEGKLLNFFRPDRLKELEESSIPFDPKKDMEVRKNQLFGLHIPVDTLVLPPEVNYVIQSAFSRHVPRRIVASHIIKYLPISPNETYCYIPNLCYVQELVIVNPDADIDVEQLLSWSGLKGIYLPKGHRIYEERDGMIYKDQGKTLVYIPPKHPAMLQDTFQIPEGVCCLEKLLFYGRNRIKQVEMPDTVTEIGWGLFGECDNLEYVRFSDRIQNIPRNTGGRGYLGSFTHGIFHNCQNLCQVHLPKDLLFIDPYAFVDSGITRIDFPEGFNRLTALHLDGCSDIKEISLPRSLEKVESIFIDFINKISIRAYEGTAKGLLSAIKRDRDSTLVWIKVLDIDGRVKMTFPAPLHPKKTGKDVPQLEKIWDGDQVCMEELYKMIPYTKNKNTRNELVLMALCYLDKDSFQSLAEYKVSSYKEYGRMLIERGDEGGFQNYLKVTRPNRAVRKALLDYCNENDRPRFISIILKLNDEVTHGKGTASLEKGKFSI